MGYLDSKGLKKYTWNVRNRVAKNDQLTKAERVVSFCPASESDLEPTINFKFTETLPAEGTKGPDNPSTIAGVSFVKAIRCGKNLLPTTNVVSLSPQTITATVDSDGGVIINGTTTTLSLYVPYFNPSYNAQLFPNFIKKNTPYTISLICSNNNLYAEVYKNSGTGWGGPIAIVYGGNSSTFNIPNEATGMIIRLTVKSGQTFTDVKAKLQIEEGSTATEFEPYSGEEYTIDLGDTYYGGNIDLAAGLMTVTWRSLTFTSCSESFQGDNGTCIKFAHAYASSQYTHYSGDYPEYFACSMFPVVAGTPENTEYCRAIGSGKNGSQSASFSILKSRLDLSGALDPSNPTDVEWIAAINAWLSEHPVTYYFKLYEPFTVQLDPVQIKSLSSPDKYNPTLNTVYTDQESVQVGWIREDFIHKTGNETIEGIKTFSNATPGSTVGDSVTDLTIRNPAVVRGVRGEGANWTRMIFADKEGNTEGNFAGRLGIFEIRSPKENDTLGEQFRFRCYKYSDNALDYSKATDIILGYDKNGIPYATAPETSGARTNSNDIVTRGHVNSVKSGLESTIEEKTWNWQKTEKNEAVSFNPVPESTLEPVVDFLFTETLPVEGEKSPANPSSITGVNEVLVGRCGKNLFNVFETPMFSYQCSEPDSDGFLTISYTNPNSSDVAHPGFYQQPSKAIKADKTYTVAIEVAEIDGCPLSFSMSLGFSQRGQLNTGSSYKDITTVGTHFITCTNNNIYNPNCFLRCMGNVSAGTTGTIKFRISVFEGIVDSSNFEYVPYSGNDYTINLGNTYYGGEIDLATGIMTVTWTCITHFYVNQVTEGTDHYQFRCYDSSSPNHAGNETAVVCSHGLTCISTGYDSKQWYVRIPKSNLDLSSATNPSSPTENELKSIGTAWLTNNNVKIVYKISDIITVQLDPVQIRSLSALDKYEPRVNTIYTDAASVQVGYQKFADEATIVYQNQRISEEEIDEAFAE